MLVRFLTSGQLNYNYTILVWFVWVDAYVNMHVAYRLSGAIPEQMSL